MISDIFTVEDAMTLGPPDDLVVFWLDGKRYALRLSAVERVVPMVEVTHLPKAPAIVLGVIDVHGRIVPVINIRRRFGLPQREIDPDDQLIIAQTRKRAVALVADGVSGLLSRKEIEIISAEQVLPAMEYVEGIIKLEDGLVLIHDLDKFLSLDEERTLDSALQDNR